MILTFSREQFVQAIIEGRKIHTIRMDRKNRWHPGRQIHFWKGNPRNTSKNPYHFATGFVTKVERIRIQYHDNGQFVVMIGGRPLTPEDIELTARRDGFNSIKSFKVWFNEDFDGKLIHWDFEKLEIYEGFKKAEQSS